MRAAAAAKQRKQSAAAAAAAAAAPAPHDDEAAAANAPSDVDAEDSGDDSQSQLSGDVVNEESDAASQSGRSDDDGMDTLATSDGYGTHAATSSSSNSTKKLAPLHRKILNALTASAALAPVHVDVKNESYWYRERARLGPKKHNALVVKQNKQTGSWEAYVFKLRPRESDGEIVPTKVIVSRHKSKWLAYKACEQGAKDRDICPADHKKLAATVDPDKLLSTHFCVTVVSERFYRLGPAERIALVYEEILKGVGEGVLLPPGAAAAAAAAAAGAGGDPGPGPGPASSMSPLMLPAAGGGPAPPRSRPVTPTPLAAAAAAAVAAAAAAAAGTSPNPRRPRSEAAFSPRGAKDGARGGASRSPDVSRMASPAMSVVHTPRTPHTPSRPGQQQQQLVDGRTYAMWNCLPERTKIGSIFGANMCALDVFRHISTSHPFHLVIEAKTPSQWRPAMYEPVPSERFHMTNLEMTSLQVPAVVRPAAHRTRIKILAKSFTDEAILAASFAKPEKRPPSTAATNTTTTTSSSSAATNGLPLTQASLGMALATSQAQAPISSFARAMFADHPTGSGDAPPPAGEGAFDLAPTATSGTGSTGSAPGAGAGTGAGPGGVTLATVRFVGASPSAGDPKSTKKKAPPPVPLAERLGVDPILLPAASGGVRIKPGTGLVQRKKPKLGGVYGHFFHELPPAVRDLIMQRVTDNKKRIQKESFLSPEQIAALKKKALRREMKNGEMDFSVDQDAVDAIFSHKESTKSAKDTFQPVTTFSKMRAKAAAAQGPAYDAGTATEHEMIEEIYIAAQKFEKIAVRLQRLRRATLFRRAARLLWRTKYAALTIQRVARGRFGRLYFAMCKKLYPLAASRIQWAFRSVKTRRLVRKWRFLTYRLTRSALPLIKRFVNNILHRMLVRRREGYNATMIQSVIRMHICRARYLRALGEELYFDELVEDAALLIQKTYRGWAGKQRHRRLFELHLQTYVDVPAALRLQRVYRGHLGRVKAEMERVRYAALILLQRNIKAWVQRVWRARMRLEAKKFRCAVMIQKRYRGRLDRELVQFRREKRYYETVYLPAVVRVQAYMRRRQAMVKYALLLQQTAAATKLQRRYRRYVELCEALRIYQARLLKFKNRMATRMQAALRGFFARLEFRRKYTVYRGRVIFAARVIMRAWMNFKFGKRFQMLMDKHRQKIYQERVERAVQARSELMEDIKEIDMDIENTHHLLQQRRTRIQDLEVFVREANLRIPYVEQQIKNLTDDDKEKGWEESFINEWLTLKNQLIMVREEIRLLRHDTTKRREELMALHLELEEAHVELDNVNVLGMEGTEGLHRNELNTAERDVANMWQRRIRMERCRWKIRNFRKNVLLRRLMKRYIAPVRDMEFAETISFEKRQRVVDREKFTAQMRMAVARTRGEGIGIQKEVKTYEEYAGPVQDTYAGVVENTLELLKGWSLDERAHRLKDETTLHSTKLRKGTKGQFAPVKEPKNAPPDPY